MQWLQQEIDKLKSESYELKQKQEDKGDVFSQLTKHRELARMMEGFGGKTETSTSSGGIGLSGGDDWKSTAVEGLVERAPQILEKLFSPGGAAAQVPQPQPQQMQQFQEGQVVDTPQGKMEVVRNPQDGQLALAPKEALDKHREALARQQGGGLLSGGSPQQEQPRPQRRRQQPQPKAPAKPSISAVPNFTEGLPKRKPPWEGGGDEAPAGAPPPPEQPPPMPRSASRKPDSVAGPADPIELSHVERQALQTIAKEVHESVNHADEPDEFVAKMLERYPANVLQQIVGTYSDRQIAQGIVQLQPMSAGATPAGRTFVAKAFRLLRHAVTH
jgi:hypothetical protein